MNYLNKALSTIKFVTVGACILAGAGINAMEQEKATWYTVPFELQLNIWSGAENNNFCAKIALLNKFRLVCRSWNSALRNNSNLKAFFEQLFLKNFTESQSKAVINFVSLVLSDQNTNPKEKLFLRRLYRHFMIGANTLTQLVNDDLPLHAMAKRGADKAASCLITLGSNKDAQNKNGWAPLHRAVVYGHLEIVRLLLAQGANKDAQGPNRLTPLHLAIVNGHLEIVRLLIAYGANNDAHINDRWTPLHWAAVCGHIEIVKLLLSHNVNTESRTNTIGLYPNMTAADVAHKKFSETREEVYKQIFNLLKSS